MKSKKNVIKERDKMKIVAIRGAITAEENTKQSILEASKELLEAILTANSIDIKNIIQITFTCTSDLDEVYPAVAARNMGITEAALMCMQEMKVKDSLEKCIRVAVLYQSDCLMQSTVCHQYLKGAKKLRPDLSRFTLAIDGPAGAGKSTIAKNIAQKLHCTYIDTGAMYRTVGLFCIQNNIDYTNEEAVNNVLSQINIDLVYENAMQRIYLNGSDVSQAIRTQEVAASASKVATYRAVRSALVDRQRKLAATKSVVMDGRDIGTVVLPQATLKVFLTASAEERAKRRLLEYKAKGIHVIYETLLKEIQERDYQDAHREVSPLKKAEDSIEMDTTSLSIEAISEQIIQLLQERV